MLNDYEFVRFSGVLWFLFLKQGNISRALKLREFKVVEGELLCEF